MRRFFDEREAGHPPDLLINQSNDGWFHGSAEHDMHLAVSIFRAIENRVPLARAVNTGVSAFIDGNGRILDSLPKLREGVLTGTIPLDDRTSLYSSWGDWLGLSCLAITIGLVPLAWTRSVFRASAGLTQIRQACHACLEAVHGVSFGKFERASDGSKDCP